MESWLLFKILVVFIFTHSVSLKDVDYTTDLERIEPIPGDEKAVWDYSKFKIIKKDRQYFLNGTLTLMENIGDNYDIVVEILHSPMMNSRFVKTPYRFQSQPFCEFAKTIFKDQIQPDLFGKTDFPIIPEEGMCPIPEGIYYIKELQMPIHALPLHMPSGMWLFECRLMEETRCVGGFRLMVKFTKKDSS